MKIRVSEWDMNQKYIRGSVAVLVGIALNFLGDILLGVKIEVFSGISTFNFAWMLDIFLVPFAVGYAVSVIYGAQGGKWLACLPPLIVRSTSFLYLHYFSHPQGDFFYQLHLFYWGPCIILAVEAANLAGILAEVQIGAYKRKDSQVWRRDAAEAGVTKT